MHVFINSLAGGLGMVEVSTGVRPDKGLQRVFGRDGFAEQSVIGDTLDACTEEKVDQMHGAMKAIYRAHSQGYGHDLLFGSESSGSLLAVVAGDALLDLEAALRRGVDSLDTVLFFDNATRARAACATG